MPNENNISRRGLFMKMGMLFNGVVAAVLAVPIVRFLLSSITRGRATALPVVGVARLRQRISRRRDAARHFPKSIRDADRR